ncbi:PREDICTED: facilitated trehalose transporter Tret1-like [Dinoponera quadriceps]|uniref:Facilitated trehalose transporter Tret1-like n=1 Tax=Dinoponera quadriceps TaxID=609295 RepID=A0A6P3XZC1_DINQU|nr:PREDICTED: facilitated trehalose transporter Tret1-like [Dinoponera quadriceps]
MVTELHADAERGKYMKPEGSRTWEYLVCFTCMIMTMEVGFVQGWSSPGPMAFMVPGSAVLLTASDAATLVALVSIGYVMTTPISMYLVDKIGRKKIMLMSALPMIVSWGLITIVMNVWMIYVARFLSGVSCSMFINVLPIYLAEVVSPSLRGAGLTLTITMFNIGILIAFVIIPYVSTSLSAGIFMSIVVVFFITFCFMPESPYYLTMKNRIEETEAVLEKIRGRTDVSDEVELILETVKSNSRQRSGGFRELLTVRANRRAFIINNVFLCAMQFSGFYTILAFVHLIFQSMTNVISDYATAIVLGVVQVISVLITTCVVDRLGRKPLLLVSGVIVASANFVIAAFFYAQDFLDMDVSACSLIPFVAMIVLMFFNNCGPISIHITVQSEIFATEIKALGTCLAGIVGPILHILVAKTYILTAVTWGFGPMPAFLSYAVCMVICTAVILRLTPETKGKTFVQIQKELSD